LAIQVRATLVCDDFRVERDGKLILIGIYGGAVVVPSLPAQLPAGGLTLFEIFQADQAEIYPIDIAVRHQDSGHLVAGGQIELGMAAPGGGYSVLKFTNAGFEREGKYVVSHSLRGTPIPQDYAFVVRVG
jgi:hypothetical protein